MARREESFEDTRELYVCDLCNKEDEDYDYLKKCVACALEVCYRCSKSTWPLFDSVRACTNCFSKVEPLITKATEAKRLWEHTLSDLRKATHQLKG